MNSIRQESPKIKPQVFSHAEIDVHAIPEELKALPQWVVWKRDIEKDTGRLLKVPYQTFNPKKSRKAKPNKPETWGHFAQAAAWAKDGGHGIQGIGFMFSEDDPFVGIDFDHCVSDDGVIDSEVMAWVESLNSYTEYSPSGRGLHVIVRGSLPRGIKVGPVEMYNQGRFFTITGASLATCPTTITEAQEGVTALFEYLTAQRARNAGSAPESAPQRVTESPARNRIALNLDDQQVIDRMLSARNGKKAGNLWAGDASGYTSQSEADLALAGILAFWTGGDANQVERIMIASGLNREKFAEKHGESTYLRRTIDRATAGCRKFYTPKRTDETWARLRAFREFVENYPWSGRRAETMQRVALAILKRFEEAHSIETYFSISQLATLGGVGVKTAQRCLHGNINKETGEITEGLKDLLPIVRTQKSNGLLASHWAITEAVFARELTNYTISNTQEGGTPPCVNQGCVVGQYSRKYPTSTQSKFVENLLTDDCFERGANKAPTRSAASMGNERSEFDVTSTLSELFNREVVANQAAKSFSNLGLRIMAFLDSQPEKRATVGQLVDALDKHPATIRATLRRMTDALHIHDHEGVLIVKTLNAPGKPLVAELPDDWRERLDTARPKLQTVGKHEARLEAIALHRIKRLSVIYQWARRQDTKEMIEGMINKQRAVMAHGKGDYAKLDKLLGRIESHVIETEPEAIEELAKRVPAATVPEPQPWVLADLDEMDSYDSPPYSEVLLFERTYLGHISESTFAEKELIEVRR